MNIEDQKRLSAYHDKMVQDKHTIEALTAENERLREELERERPTDSNYTQHFLDWRNKHFEFKIQVKHWKSKSNWLSTNELHKFYEQAMLTSPFNQALERKEVGNG